MTFDGATCRVDGPTTFVPGDIVSIEFANTTE